MSFPFREIDKSTLEVFVKVTPKASKNKVSGMGMKTVMNEDKAFIRVFVTSAPERGKANEAVVSLLSKTWRLAKSQIVLVAGATASFKTFRLISLDESEKEFLERKLRLSS